MIVSDREFWPVYTKARRFGKATIRRFMEYYEATVDLFWSYDARISLPVRIFNHVYMLRGIFFF